ncbi:TIR domain-containing protein [Citrobacter amalonaticus]|uniref:TIR domain-containing protein n=1 Tax=Citrobacter amalonaticus TaxID=35703 RepID=UPI00300D392B
MTVFISYRHTDFSAAWGINKKLNDAGIKTYLDKLDAESQTTDDITTVITKNILQSTHLIAVVSAQTAASWWVPFEIGEATVTERRITSFQVGISKLPEYLDKWPKMITLEHIDLFIQEYKNEYRTVSGSRFSVNESHENTFIRNSNNANDFHRALKSKISRGF